MGNVLITGVTGMDGSILAEKMLSKGDTVFGLVRTKKSSPNHWRIQHLLEHAKFNLIEGDITSIEDMTRAIGLSQPEKIFNLAAHSFVPHSWAEPLNTFHVVGTGVLNILEAIRNTNRSIRFYQASSSEMFGRVNHGPQNERTPFQPYSPYGVAKVAAQYATTNYRESFGMFAASGILFNHEHESRGDQFVTRKITKGVSQFYLNKIHRKAGDPLRLGNLDGKRDWGYAEDYVQAMIQIINHPVPETFVIATGIQRTVRCWCEATVAATQKHLNLPEHKVEWKGTGLEEKGFVGGDLLFEVAKEFYRPSEIHCLYGDPAKAARELKWKAQTPFEIMIERMVGSDVRNLQITS